jgi:hypothetical protein
MRAAFLADFFRLPLYYPNNQFAVVAFAYL